MKYSSFRHLFIICIVLLTYVPASSAEMPAGMNAFVHSYLAAAKKNDPEAITKLTHPAFLECFAEGEPEKYDQLVQQQINSFSRQDPIMKITYQLFADEDLKKMAKSMKKRKIKWPINPEGRVIIMYASFHKISKMAILVAQDETGWKWVHYCKEEDEEETDPVVLLEKFKLFSHVI